MKVKSTGLGKTQLQCHFDGFHPKEDGEDSVVMIITSTAPVSWHIEADLGGKDLRQMAGQMLKPATVWHLLKLLVKGSEAKGFVMEKEGGRRSSRERVVRSAAPVTATPATQAAETPVTAPAMVAAPVSAPPRPTQRVASSRPVDDGDDARREREARRAERRKAREERAAEYATA